MASSKVESSLERYREIRSATEALVATLSPEDCQIQSMPETSPTKWHLAHTSWFFETFLLLPHFPGYQVAHPKFAYLFNSYYNAVGDRVPRLQRGLMSRPSFDEVQAYRRSVDSAMFDLLPTIPTTLVPIVELGLNHEQQHQELILTDIKHAFAINPLQPVFREEVATYRRGASAPLTWHTFAGGIHRIGCDGPGFAFDNETPRHKVYLENFQLASRLVTCREFIDFMQDGGYNRSEFWLSDGWAIVNAQQWNAPLYWSRVVDNWELKTLHGSREVYLDEPVCHVSFYEADAFARWAGARLPTEAEWEVAASDQPITGRFAEGGRFHPQPASTHSVGITQLFGDAWEWTQSPYTPYPHSKPVAGALGEYNAKFMCSQIVLRGGSCVTPASHLRASYRNFFPPEARWQFSGIRLAKDT